MSVNGVPFNSSVGGIGNVGQPSIPGKAKGIGDGPSFQQTLDQLKNAPSPQVGNVENTGLKFSTHAVERMRTRGVQFGPEQMQKLNSAVEKARAKGAKETLVLADNAALIVSVKNNTVVTVMDSQALKENVFTNIDSTVVI